MSIIVTSDMLVEQMGEIANERDTYRELCGELLKEIKSAGDALDEAEYDSDIDLISKRLMSSEIITKAEHLLGENNAT